VALSARRLEEPELQFISGHLHQTFYYKNYLCTGSIWATSPLEENQLKGFRKRNQGKLSFYETGSKYYFFLDREEQTSSLFDTAFNALASTDIHAHHTLLQHTLQGNFPTKEVDYHFLPKLDLKSLSLSLRVNELNYQKMDTFVAPELQQQLSDVKLRKQQTSIDDLLEKLQKPDTISLQEGFGGWIDLLKRFLIQQYPDQYPEYEKLLQELKLV
jgi:hypothetical protein